MTTFSRLSLAGLITVTLSSFAIADGPIVPLPRPIVAGGLSIPAAGFYGPAYFGGGSTAHESILRGQADVIRARGEHALMTAEAARSLEEAKSRYLDNEVKRLTVRQERKRLGIAERAHRYEHIQSRRETQMALNRAAREVQQAAAATVQIESQAEGKLRLAIDLLKRGNVEAGVASLQEIAQQFHQTEAGQQAASILAEING
ncbi:MAG: hypothetical protein KF861_13730 [Planctomycetaceae bacterium]|nr:hypothetical protein [Planctomycetaceae bacterium]